MGMFKVPVRVANPSDPSRVFEQDFWVDTGAFHSMIPEDRLHEIGIVPIRTMRTVLADGRESRNLLGEVKLSIPDLEAPMTCAVFFGPPGSLFLLGATSLEAFAVQADPVTQTLKPITVILAALAAPIVVAPEVRA
jgi:predicted aspartyl protease